MCLLIVSEQLNGSYGASNILMLRPLDPYERRDVARKEELFGENSY